MRITDWVCSDSSRLIDMEGVPFYIEPVARYQVTDSDDESRPSFSFPNAGKMPRDLSISREMEMMPTRDVLADIRRKADDIRSRWMSELDEDADSA